MWHDGEEGVEFKKESSLEAEILPTTGPGGVVRAIDLEAIASFSPDSWLTLG